MIDYLGERCGLDLSTKENLKNNFKQETVCYMFSNGKYFMNTLAFVCKFATAIANEKEELDQ